ncbi:hypothetical protein A3712_13265 [Vibrio sp. HI00D65]|uniref:hypothetical protein n=1 Tax=Vibrio sp. HI00D65 TaxID=1822216 RepID=UPI0007B8A74F|nr:hypothetical protein [Vibrio sp. HI00D65]KZX68614.1 hypothetical protein A3712_13265 [Vibrio sp. HI00D65]
MCSLIVLLHWVTKKRASEQSLTEVKSLPAHLNLAVNINKKALANSVTAQWGGELCELVKRYKVLGIQISINDFGMG